VIGSLTPGYPAVEAGLMEGDRILSVGGLPVSHWNEMAQIIHGSPGKSVTIEIDREGQHHTLTVMPRLEEKSGRGLVGISPENETISRRYPVLESISRGFKRNVELLGLTFKFIWDLLTFNTSLKLLGGPIMIFQVTGEVARAGVSEFIAFMAFLSLQLGVLNLLPIPVLDGGHLLFLGLEGIKGRPLEPRSREMAQRIGFFLLLLLILVVSYNDILRILTSR
jgi:regulator of sigma E protease